MFGSVEKLVYCFEISLTFLFMLISSRLATGIGVLYNFGDGNFDKLGSLLIIRQKYII